MGYFDGFESTPTRGTQGDPNAGDDAPADNFDSGDAVDSGGSGGGGSDPEPEPEPVTRRVDLTEEQRRAFAGTGSDLVEREVSVGGGTTGGVRDIAPAPGVQTPDTNVDVVDSVQGVASDVAAGIGNTVDFVTSGPDEPSVGDPEFSDPGTVDTPTTGGDTNTTVDPSRPSTGINQSLVNETTSTGGFFSENPNSSDGVVPGSIANVDVSEQRLDDLAGAGADLNERITEKETSTPPVSAPTAAPTGPLNNALLNDAAGNTVQGAAALPAQAESAAEFVQNAPLNQNSVQTAGSVATAAAAATSRKALNNPAEFGAEVGFGFATGTAGTRAGLRAADPAPISTRRARFATGEESVTTARSLELGTQRRNVRPISTVDGRPTTGTPGVDLDEVDLRQQGEARGPAFEPETRFEADVVERSLRERGNTEAADRIGAVRDVVDEADTVDTGTVTRQQVEEAVADTDRIDADAAQVVDELADAEATVFGSGAVRAQRPDFRSPGDIDAVVPDATESQATQQLAGLGDFDLKTPDDFAGLRAGENFGFGARSRSPIDVADADGLGVNPVGEELQRKAGASGFLRRRIDEDDRLDVGPRPSIDANNPSGFEFSARRKDVTDAADLAEVGLGPADPATRQFREAFGLEDGARATSTAPRRTGLDGFGFRDFVDETRGQAALGRGARRVDLDDTTRRVDTDDTSPVRRGDGDDTTTSPSPTGRRVDSSPSRIGGGLGASSVFGGSPVFGDSPAGTSPTGSPDSSTPGSSTPGSTSPGSSPTTGGGFGGSPTLGGSSTGRSPSVDSPDGTRSPAGSPTFGGSPVFGGSPTSPSPTTDSPDASPTPSPTPSPGDSPGGSPGDSPGGSPGSPPSPPGPPTTGGGVPSLTPPGDSDGSPNNPSRTEVDPDLDGRPSEEEYAITGLGELFDSEIASGREALESIGLGDTDDRFSL